MPDRQNWCLPNRWHWSSIFSDRKNYGLANNRGYRYVIVGIDNFSKIGCTTSLKNRNAQTIKDIFQKVFMNQKDHLTYSKEIEIEDFYNSIFQSFSNNNNSKLFSRNTSLGAVFAERFLRTIRDLLKRPFFERGDAKLIVILPTKTNQSKVEFIHLPSWRRFKLVKKKNEGLVHNNLLDKRKKIKAKFQITISLEQQSSRKRFPKEIHLIGLLNCIESQKWLMILFRVVVLIIYQIFFTKLCWKRRS